MPPRFYVPCEAFVQETVRSEYEGRLARSEARLAELERRLHAAEAARPQMATTATQTEQPQKATTSTQTWHMPDIPTPLRPCHPIDVITVLGHRDSTQAQTSKIMIVSDMIRERSERYVLAN
jgi:hypothetical protein